MIYVTYFRVTLYHNADNEQTTDPGGYRTHTYNVDGDQTAYSEVGKVPATYSYDPENNLVSLAYGDGDGTTGIAYDALGRETARSSGGVVTQFFFDGNNVLDDLTGSTWTPLTWGPNGQVRRGTEFPFYDGLDSIMGDTNSSLSVTLSIVFDAFGRPQTSTGSSADQYQYKAADGYRNDGDGDITGQGLYKVGAREYDPLFGRFISRDTDLSQSPYSYYLLILVLMALALVQKAMGEEAWALAQGLGQA